MPDTNVYIMLNAGTLKPEVAGLLRTALAYHCVVCLAELALGLANYHPAARDWNAVRDSYIELFASIPAQRLLAPDPEVWTSAGIVAGTLAGTQGFQPHQRKQCLNDAVIYLTAAKAGIPLLTANRVEFDLIEQLAPGGAVLYV
jgi:predicted nucleic acid-binding protein